MATTGFFHHIGTFLLLAATVLLIITDISAPVVHDISMLKVTLANGTSAHHSTVSFGTFGYCLIDAADGNDYCSNTHIGYNPAAVMASVEGTGFSTAAADTSRALTRVMVLHPVATGICFIAFLLAAGAGLVGSFMAALVSTIGFIVTLVALVCDFVSFGIVKQQVNGDGTGSDAAFAVASWTILASAACSLVGAVVVFFTCCSARLHRRRAARKSDFNSPPAARRRRFW